MAISSKKQLNNKYFTQSSGDTFVLSGDTVISGNFRYAEGKVPTGATDFVSRETLPQGSNGIKLVDGNYELGGRLTGLTLTDNVVIESVSTNLQIKGKGNVIENNDNIIDEFEQPENGDLYDIVGGIALIYVDNEDYIIILNLKRTNLTIYIKDKINDIGFKFDTNGVFSTGFTGNYISGFTGGIDENYGGLFNETNHLLTEDNLFILFAPVERNDTNVKEVGVFDLDQRTVTTIPFNDNQYVSGNTTPILGSPNVKYDAIIDENIQTKLVVWTENSGSTESYIYLLNVTNNTIQEITTNINYYDNKERNNFFFRKDFGGTVNNSFQKVSTNNLMFLDSQKRVSLYDIDANIQYSGSRSHEYLLFGYYETEFGGEYAYIVSDDLESIYYLGYDDTLSTIFYDQLDIRNPVNLNGVFLNQNLKGSYIEINENSTIHGIYISFSLLSFTNNLYSEEMVRINASVEDFTKEERSIYYGIEISANFFPKLRFPNFFIGSSRNITTLGKLNISSFPINLTSSGFTYPSTYTNPNADNLITRRVLSGQTINDYTSYSANTENIAGADAFNDLKNNVETLSGSTNTFTNGLTEDANDVVSLGGSILADTTITSVSPLTLRGNTNINLVNTIFNEIIPENYTIPVNTGYAVVDFGLTNVGGAFIYNIITAYRGGDFEQFILVYEEDLGSDIVTELVFSANTNPSGWSGDTINVGGGTKFVAEVITNDRYSYVREVDSVANGTIEVYLFDFIGKTIKKISTLIPEITNFTDPSFNRVIQPVLQIENNDNNNNFYKLLFNDVTTNILYVYDSESNTKKIISGGDAVSGDTNTLPNFIRASFNRQSNDGSNTLVIETTGTTVSDRFLVYNLTGDTVSYLTILDNGLDILGELINLNNKDILDYEIFNTIGYVFRIITLNKTISFSTSQTGTAGIKTLPFNPNTNFGGNSKLRKGDFTSSLRYYFNDGNEPIIYEVEAYGVPFSNGIINRVYIFDNPPTALNQLRYYIDNKVTYVNNDRVRLSTINDTTFDITSGVNGFKYPSTYSPDLDNLITRRVLSGQTINDYTSYSANTENIAGADAFHDLRLDVETLSGSTNTFTNGLTEDANDVVSLGGVVDIDSVINSTVNFDIIGNDIDFRNIKTEFINSVVPDTINTVLPTNYGILDFNYGSVSGLTFYVTSGFQLTSSFEPFLDIIIEDNNSGTTTQYYFTTDSNPIDWSGDTLNGGGVYFSQDLIINERYILLRELGNNAPDDILIFNVITRGVERLSNNISNVSGYTENNGDYSYSNVSIVPKNEDKDEYKIFYLNQAEKILYVYDSLANTTKTIQSGDTVSGDLTEMTDVVRASFLYTSDFDDNILIIENSNTSFNQRFLSYNLSGDSVTILPAPPDNETTRKIDNIGIDDLVDFTAHGGLGIGNVYIYVTKEYVLRTSNAFDLVTYKEFDSVVENGLTKSSIRRNNFIYNQTIDSNNNFNYTLFNNQANIDRLTIVSVNGIPFDSTLNFLFETIQLYLSININNDYYFTNEFVAVINGTRPSIQQYVNQEFNVSLDDNGFQYPSTYSPTEQTSLLTLGNRNETSNSIVTGNTTLTNSDHTVFVDSSGSTLTVTLVATPKDGLVYTIKDATGNASVNPITIDGNGKTIDGQTSITINIDYYGFELTYSATLDAWLITNTINY